jgi:hypothetical protein
VRISKRLRAEAADLCAIMASECAQKGRIVFIASITTDLTERWSVSDYETWLRDEVVHLAARAFAQAQAQQDPQGMISWLDWVEAYAEAEAMLREGWKPS